MSNEKNNNRVASHSSYGTFQGVATYPPPSHPRHPVAGFHKPSPTHGAPHHDISVHQYIEGHQTVPGYDVVEGRPVRENSLPCCGLGIGWFLFVTGFLLVAIPWYVGVFILVRGRINPQEKAGYVASTIAAVLATITIAIVFGFMGGRGAWS